MFAYSSAPAGTYQTLDFGYLFDSVYVNGGQLQLTTTYGGNIAFWHNWSPQWASSLNAGYVKWHYGAAANNIICTAPMLAVARRRVASAPVSQAATTTTRSGPLVPGLCGPRSRTS